VLTPLVGCAVFILLYIIAASLYPGGSHANVHSKGFSWQHNYWCNLLNEKALNSDYNAGRYVAMAGMIILAMTLLSFWIISANVFQFSKPVRIVMLLSAFLAIAILPFLSSSLHDTVINSSGFFGLVAMAGTYIGIYRNRWYWLFMVGVINLLLIGLNNYIYYSEAFFYFLPVVQKITFLSCLIWICLVDIKLYRHL
jgi:hypothetical protein